MKARNVKKIKKTGEGNDYLAIIAEDINDKVQLVLESQSALGSQIKKVHSELTDFKKETKDNFKTLFEFRKETQDNFKTVFEYLSNIDDEIQILKRELKEMRESETKNTKRNEERYNNFELRIVNLERELAVLKSKN